MYLNEFKFIYINLKSYDLFMLNINGGNNSLSRKEYVITS